MPDDRSQTTEIGEFTLWLVEYAETPLDPELVRQAERKDLSVKTLLSLGHGAAVTAVSGKVNEILRARNQTTGEHDRLDENMIRDRRRLAPRHWSNSDIDCLLRQLDLARAERDASIRDLEATDKGAYQAGREKGYEEGRHDERHDW